MELCISKFEKWQPCCLLNTKFHDAADTISRQQHDPELHRYNHKATCMWHFSTHKGRDVLCNKQQTLYPRQFALAVQEILIWSPAVTRVSVSEQKISLSLSVINRLEAGLCCRTYVICELFTTVARGKSEWPYTFWGTMCVFFLHSVKTNVSARPTTTCFFSKLLNGFGWILVSWFDVRVECSSRSNIISTLQEVIQNF
jgi:hypothetical protein